MHQVLVVEDDEDVASPLARAIEAEGYDAVVVSHGRQALDHVGRRGTDLVILDLGLPDMDGLDVATEMRRSGFGGGLIMLTVRVSELDIVTGLDAGADDYMTKPVSVAELQSRIRSVLRRSHRAYGSTVPATAGSLRIEPAERRVTYDGQTVVSSGREYDVLAHLMANHGRVLTHDELTSGVWGAAWSGSPKVLHSAVARVRDRLAAVGAPERIESVRSVGFRLTST